MQPLETAEPEPTRSRARRRKHGRKRVCVRACILVVLVAAGLLCVLLSRRADAWQKHAEHEAGRAAALHRQLRGARLELFDEKKKHKETVSKHLRDRRSDEEKRGRLEVELKEALGVIESARLRHLLRKNATPAPVTSPHRNCVKRGSTVDRPFADISNLTAHGDPSVGNARQWANACGLQCAATAACGAWTYCRTCEACWLYSAGDIVDAPAGYARWAGARGCVDPSVPPLGFTRTEGGVWPQGVMLEGGAGSTVATCGARCSGSSECAAFSVRTAGPGAGKCYHFGMDSLGQEMTVDDQWSTFVRTQLVQAQRDEQQAKMEALLGALGGGDPGYQHPLERFFGGRF